MSKTARRSPNARLQDDIILYLEQGSVKSVAELARLLRSPRPSVSRAVNDLMRGGFVCKDAKAVSLSSLGLEEALRLHSVGGRLVETGTLVLALKFYANKRNWISDDYPNSPSSPISRDYGERARIAIAGTEEGNG